MTSARLSAALPLLLTAAVLVGCAAGSAYRHGKDFAAAEDWDRAVYFYSKALSHDPQNIEYRKSLDLAKVKASQHHFELAKSYMESGALDLAIVEYRVAASLDPTNRFVADSLEKALETKKELEVVAPGPTELEKLKEDAKGQTGQPLLRPSSDTPITLSFPPNTKVKDIYTALGKAAGINMLFDPGIRDQETFSIDIAKASFKKALDMIALANKHFYKVIDERTLMIIPDNPQKRRDYEDHIIRTFYLSNANPNDVVNTLRGLLDARRIATNAALNAITIRDTPAKISVMERVIESNDKPPSEVVIDVEILEVTRTNNLNYGAGLSRYTATEGLEQPDTITTGEGDLRGLRWSSIPFINASDWLLTFPSIIYRLEKNAGNVRTLARPSLRALDGKQVTLRLGDQVPIETSTFIAGGVGQQTRNFQFRDIGTNIDITPRVHHNGEVTLQLQVEVTSRGEDPDGSAGPIPPTFGNRRINTEIRLKDGETNLLAGLFTSSETRSRAGLPIISDLPVLRSLFSSNTRTKSETDIVLTLTPHIVRTPNIKREDLEPFYVGTESNVGGITDVGIAPSLGGSSPFTPPAGTGGGEEEGGSPGAPPPPGGRPTPRPRPALPGGPVALPGQPSGGLVPGQPAPAPTPFNPEPGQPSPTGLLPEGPRDPGAAPTLTPIAPSTPTPTPAVVAPALVTLVPPVLGLAVAEERNVDIVVEGATGVSHAPFWLTYDPAVLEAVGAVEGAFLRADGQPTTFLNSLQQAGQVVIGLSRLGSSAGASGSGVLASVRFRGRAPGRTALGFVNSSLRDAQSRPLPATFAPGTATVR